ncbi:MAG TPA: ParB/RepB/Spo0J family partition protein [Solirubrobacterales bacterium]|jgi:ParB/RepB/Spo0J family partition protein|nr:ParB/RepB/Spo0J family partition protein [Solirubrobacterales bacterium]
MTQVATTDLATPEVDIDLVHVVEGRNPRRHMDPQLLERMTESIGSVGLIKPLQVDVVDDHFELVTGHRRLRAAQMAGLAKVPISIRKAGRTSEVMAAENDHVEKLDVISQALSYKALKAEFNFSKNEQVAKQAKVSVAWVGDHLRLLNLPEGVQAYFAEGIVPLEGERPLRSIARVSPRVAECVCEVAKRRKLKKTRFVDEFYELLSAVPETKFDDPPTMIPVSRVSIAEVVADPETREKIVARLAEVWSGSTVTEDTRISFSEEEIDIARAAHVLLEYERKRGGWITPLRFICDAEFAADLADRATTRTEAEVKKDRERRETWAAEAAAASEGVDPSASEEEQAAQRKKAEAKRKRDEAKQRKALQSAAAFNEEVGRKMTRRHAGKACSQRSGVRFGVLVDLLIEDRPHFGTGLRLVLPQLRETDGSDTTYATPEQATDYLVDRIGRTDSLEEKVELLIEALVADQAADRSVLSARQQFGPYFLLDEGMEKVLEPDIRAVTPRPQKNGN